MSLYLFLTLLLVFDVKISFQEDIENLSKKDCVVKEVKSGQRKPCQFPFIFSNQTFYGCTIFQSENGNPWCSTKADPLGREHLFTSLACYLAWPLDILIGQVVVIEQSRSEAFTLKVSKFQKQIFLFSSQPKTERNYFFIFALRF
jgi:hypothetical protein